MIELALSMPVLMLMLTGIYSLGAYLQQSLELTDAVSVGAKLVSINRANTLDPCKLVYNAVTQAAPFLALTSSNFAYTFDGQGYSGSSCSSATTSSGAPSYLVQGTPVTVTVTYPCANNITLYFGDLVPNCQIVAQLTEIEQ